MIVGGKYHLERVLGRGEMGTVFEGKNAATGRTVAVKVLRAHLADSGEAVARFQAETRAVASVSHENVVDVFDMGVERGDTPYVVLEFARGSSVASELERGGPWSVERAVHVAGQVLAGLAAAHAEGILHRDLRAKNVMLTVQGATQDCVKLFGFRGSEGQGSDEEPLDVREDLHAVGVLLYEMLGGRAPLEVPADGAIALEPAPGLDPGLESVVRRALGPAADDRWPDARAMGAALVPWGAAPLDDAEHTDTLTRELRQLRMREIQSLETTHADQGRRPLVSGAALRHVHSFLVKRLGQQQTDAWLATRPELEQLVTAELDPAGWYASPAPIALLEEIDREVGDGDRQLVAEAARYIARAAAEHELGERTLTPELLITHIPDIWALYLPFGEVTVASISRGFGRIEVSGLPHANLALSAAILGYVDEALRIAGAREVDVRMHQSSALGDPKDVYEVSWI